MMWRIWGLRHQGETQSKNNGVKEEVVEGKQGDQKGHKASWEEKERVFTVPLCGTEMLQGWYSQ